MPVGDREHAIVEYLTHRSMYGEGFDEMRKAMVTVVDCFREERGDIVPRIPGDYGLTAQFLALAGPAQATICGSSSFRLDLVAKYLSADGPDEYFRRGLQIEYQDLDAKRLADDVLDEVLGVYYPPEREVPRSRPVCRSRIGRSPGIEPEPMPFTSACSSRLERCGGRCWRLRGYSFGESFVARNVGVRTIWSQGQWCVRLIFQDHDNLVLPDENQAEYWPMTALPPTSLG